MIRLDSVTKAFEGTVAVDDVTLDVAPERTTVLIGPSGSGKSTLLRMMLGLVRPDAGQVFIGDVPLASASMRRIRRRVGYVIQDGGLFPHLTAFDNVALLARHLGWPEVRIQARIENLTERVHLDPDRLQQFPTELSGGQRQRVSLMRALMQDPDVLLLDEPLGALDPMIRASLQEDLRGVFQRLDKTVVLVTHDIGEAGYLGDHVVLLRQGRIVQEGTMQGLVDAPANDFVDAFIRAQRAPFDNLDD